MRTSHRISMLGAALLLAGQTACVFPTGEFSLLAAEKIPLRTAKLASQAEGENCTTRVLGMIPIGARAATVAGAVDEAMASQPKANVMTAIEAKASVANFILANRSCVRVTGEIGVAR